MSFACCALLDEDPLAPSCRWNTRSRSCRRSPAGGGGRAGDRRQVDRAAVGGGQRSRRRPVAAPEYAYGSGWLVGHAEARCGARHRRHGVLASLAGGDHELPSRYRRSRPIDGSAEPGRRARNGVSLLVGSTRIPRVPGATGKLVDVHVPGRHAEGGGGAGDRRQVRGLPLSPNSSVGGDHLPPEYVYRRLLLLVATQKPAAGQDTHDRPLLRGAGAAPTTSRPSR